jgi:hypothetical protein
MNNCYEFLLFCILANNIANCADGITGIESYGYEWMWDDFDDEENHNDHNDNINNNAKNIRQRRHEKNESNQLQKPRRWFHFPWTTGSVPNKSSSWTVPNVLSFHRNDYCCCIPPTNDEDDHDDHYSIST